MGMTRGFSGRLGWPSYLLFTFITVAGAILLITGAGWTLDYRGVWAFSHLAYVPATVRWGMGVFVVLSGIVTARHVAQPAARERWSRYASLLWRVPRWATLAALGALFWLLRERTFHGDALLKLHLLSAETLQTDPYVWKEPLDSLLAYSSTRLFDAFGLSPETAIACLSVAAGILYAASALRLAGLLGGDGTQRLAFFAGLMALGSSLLWFGHVENYSLVTAVTLCSVSLAIAYLRGRGPLWPVGLAAGAAVSVHPQAIFTLPALALLLDRRRLGQGIVLAATTAVVPAFTAGVLWLLGVPPPNLSGGYAGDEQLFWSASQAVQPQRLADALNNLWLVAPLLPFLPFALVYAMATARVRRDRVFVYLTALMAGLLVYHFSFQNDLARQKDWDLFAIVGPGVTLWVGYVMLAADGRLPSMWTASLAIGLTFATLFTVSWIGVNHAYTLIRPDANARELAVRYRRVDLYEHLDTARISPAEPICAEATGCERVTRAWFIMPEDGDSRPVIFAHAPAEVVFPINVPEREAFLWLSPALDPEARGWGGDGVTFEVAVQSAEGEVMLWRRHLRPDEPGDMDWQEANIPLDAVLGQDILLILRTLPGPANDSTADRAGWGTPWLMEATLDTRWVD